MVYGIKLEKEYKTIKFAILYFISGIIGNMFSCVFQADSLSVGASSSISGVINNNKFIIYLIIF